MAKIRGSKEGFANDPSMSMPTEQKTSESNKQKIAKIHDMFQITTKENIAKILQYYDDDENQVIDAITRDGGKEALSNWAAESSSLKSRNTKKNKRKKKSKKDLGLAISTTASFDADDSSSIHSGCNVDIEGEKDSLTTENGNGILPEVADKSGNLDNILSNHEHLNNNEAETLSNPPEKEIAPHKLASIPTQAMNAPVYEDTAQRASVSSDCNRNSVENVSRVSPLSENSDKQEEHSIKRDKFRSINENYSRHSPRQRTSSFRRNKSSSISEDSSSQHNPQAAAVPTKRDAYQQRNKGYERCKKDLHRQTASLQRINSQLEKGFEDSEKRLRNAFADIIKQIENRQKDIELELAKRKSEAFNLLKSRQDLGTELNRRVDRTSSLSEAEWSELRSDIKQFVTERKYDDDLGKTIWFHWPDISETIKTFGEVHPVKNVYSQRSHSSHDNTPSNNPEPSPSSSLANDEIESSADKNDVANIADAVEDETTVVGKEETPVFNKNQQQPTESRGTRIYQNKNFGRFNPGRFPPNNRGGYFRGRGGAGGFQRPYPRNNYPFPRQNHYEDYNKNHPHPERDVRINDAYPGDRNPNHPRDYKNNRSRGRGGPYPNNNFRYDNRPSRGGNASGPRHNVEHSEPQPPLHAAANSNIEKSNAVNGFVNNNNN